MQKTLEAIDEAIAKVIRNVTSSKFWFNMAPVILGALTVIESGGNWIQAVIGALMVIGGAGNYTYSKLRQNIEYIRNVESKTQPHVNQTTKTIEVHTEEQAEDVKYAGVDWQQFMHDVEVEKNRIISSIGAVPSFALYSSLQTVGRNYMVNNIDDVRIFADMVYSASLDWWKELAGFDYWDAVNNGVPDKFRGMCKSADLNLWIRVNKPEEKKMIIMEIKNALNKVNKSYELDETIFDRYADWQKNLTYIWETL